MEVPHLAANLQALVGPGALVLAVSTPPQPLPHQQIHDAPMTMMLYGSVTSSLPSQQVRLSTTSKFGCISSHHRGNRCTQPQPMHTSATTLPSPVSPFPPAQLHRHPLRWRTQHGSTHCKISARMSTVPTMRPRATRRSLHSSCDPLEQEQEKKKRRQRSHQRSGSTSTNSNQTANEQDFSSA